MKKSLIEVRRDLHRIPEPGFAEFKTQQYVLDYIAQLPQEHLTTVTWRTGVLVHVEGKNPSRTIGYRADMDGLPIQEATSYDFQSFHSGFMHACGHDLHMTIALGILRHFSEHRIDDNLLVIFQPAEEGPGGALPMLASEEFATYRPDVIFALHIAPEYPVGTIATKPGILFANTSELFIDLEGRGGHAAFPHKANDMIVAGAHFITQLQTIVARNIDPLDSAVVTIGKLEAGVKMNIIAGTARVEGTIRTLSVESMQRIKSRIEALVRGVEVGFDCKASIDYGANYRQVTNDEVLTRDFMDWLRKNDQLANLHECREAMTGEDFGYFLGEIPGFMFWLGVDTPFGLHHEKLEPHEDAIQVAVNVMTHYVTFIGTSSL